MDDLYLDTTLLASAEHLKEKMQSRQISLYLTGLAASGKTAVAATISRITGVPLVDSGLPFRLATYLCGAVPALHLDLALFERVLSSHSIRIVRGEFRLYSGEQDITERLRWPEVEAEVPRIAGDPRFREIVLRFLRGRTKAPAIVAARGATEPLTDGHLLQIELRTDFAERVKRRSQQAGLPLQTVKKSIRERDERDLFGAARYPSADYIDSTHLTLEETVARVIERATERIGRLYEFNSFRRQPMPDDAALCNPLLEAVWRVAEPLVADCERRADLPVGHVRSRYLLHLSRFTGRDLFGPSFLPSMEWTAGTFPNGIDVASLTPARDLLVAEANRITSERRTSVDTFLKVTRLPERFFRPVERARLTRVGAHLLAKDDTGNVIERYDVRDASRELGIAIEEHLHYLGVPRTDTTHRLVLVEESTDLPILYISIAPNSRRYFEPLLWAFGLRMEEVAIAVRGYGSPRCPKNAMGLFLRLASKRAADDFPHLKAILTDINPNWGFTGNSFREAGFIEVGVKHAPTSFIGEDYASRRAIEGARGRKAATPHRLPLVPTLIMLRPFSDAISNGVKPLAAEGLYVIPRMLYDKG